MASMSPPSSGWENDILQSAIPFMNAKVCFFSTSLDDYDPVTGVGGDDEIVPIFIGKCRVQQLRTPREFTTSYEVNTTRYIRFQLDPNDNPPAIYEGTYVRILDGGRDPVLETLICTVNAAVNSSHMAVRTVEAAANMHGVDWLWAIDENGEVVNVV